MSRLAHPARLRPGFFLVLLYCWFCPHVWAGDASSASGAIFHAPETVAAWQQQIEQTLEPGHTTLAIIARTGRPRSQLPDDMRYVHSAYLVYEPAVAADGEIVEQWFTYQLFRDAEDKHHSHLAVQPLAEFLAGSCEADVGVLVPVPVLQQKTLTALREHGGELRREAYHLLANPHRMQFENCNTWMLRVLFAGLYDTTDDARLTADMRAYFQPQVVELGLWYRLGGGLADVLEGEDKGPNGYQTATFTSFERFLQQQGLLEHAYTFAIPPED